MLINVTPYYDSNGPKVSVGEHSKKLANADAKSISQLSADLKKEKDKLRAEVMYVTAIRLYDLGQKDEAVYWFYTAQYRARTRVVLRLSRRGSSTTDDRPFPRSCVTGSGSYRVVPAWSCKS